MSNKVALKPLTVACALIFTFGLSGCDNKVSAGSASSKAPDVEVMTVTMTSLKMNTELPGRTSAFRVSEIRPQISGIITHRLFTEGSYIKAGQPLYQIDPAPYQAAWNNARAELAQAQANANIAQLTWRRYRALQATHYVSQQDIDQAAATAQQRSAAVEAAKAAVESARINLAWSTITSPLAGRIGRSGVTEGALVQSGQTEALASVQQLDPVYVDVTQSSRDYLRLQDELASGKLKPEQGQATVNVLMTDGSVYPHSGKLQFSDITVDQTTGSVTLRAVVPNPDHLLLPGMFVRARLEEGTDTNAILIPQQAVTRTPRGDATTLVVDKNNQVESRLIEVEQTANHQWLVTGGLQVGERIILSGMQRAEPGAVVSPHQHPPESDNAS